MENQKYALLIDSDNISHKYISLYILDEMTKYGVTTYKRIYGDWTSPQAGSWREETAEKLHHPHPAVSEHRRQKRHRLGPHH